MRNLPVIVGLILILSLCGISCSRSQQSGAFASVDPSCWLYGDTVSLDVFAPTDTDTLCVRDVVASIRHANTYKYSNIWIETSICTDDTTVRTDTIKIQLCDEMGNWYGNGIGTDFMITDTILRAVPMMTGRAIKVRHIMRVDTLTGIEMVGIKVTPTAAT